MDRQEQPYLPLVSFCISTFKRTDYLKRQLEAIEKQSNQNYEVIVSDNDASECSAKEIVELFNRDRFHYISNEANLGMVKSFNKSLSKASGEYVVMLTDDDPVYPQMLEILLDLADKFPQYGLFMGSHDTNYEKLWLAQLANLSPGNHSGLASFEIGHTRLVEANEFLYSFCTADFGGGILWSAGMVKRSIALSIGGVPDYGTPFMSDAAYLILAGSQSGAVFINTAVGSQTIHGSNFSYANADYSHLESAPKAFYKFIKQQLPNSIDEKTDVALQKYLGKTLTTYYIFLKKVLQTSDASNKSFQQSIKEIYKWPVMKKWYAKYKIGTRYPEFFKLIVQLKKIIIPQ